MSEEEKQSRPRREKRMSVYGYLVILFAAAFLLLLFAYLMQQRNSEEIMGNLNELRESMSSVHSVNELLEENRTLREENETLQSQLDELETQLEAAKAEYATLEGSYEERTMQVSVLEILYTAEIKIGEEDYAGAAAALTALNTDSLEKEIARYDAQTAQSPFLRERYEAIAGVLIEEGCLLRDEDGNLTVVIPADEE